MGGCSHLGTIRDLDFFENQDGMLELLGDSMGSLTKMLLLHEALTGRRHIVYNT